MRLDHPIFHGPLQPKIELGTVATPSGYRHWNGGAELPATLPCWKVQTGEVGKTVDYGLVSDPVGFEDSPDTEWISSGVNSKGPNSMALGRHGNWFLWGFAGDPTQMTESAQQVFLNAIVWMKQFDGAGTLVSLSGTAQAGVERMPGRDSVFDHVCFLRAYGDQKEMSDYVHGLFPAALMEETGGDPQKLLDYYADHVEYLHPVKVHRTLKREGSPDVEYDSQLLEVDPALYDLGVSNRKPEFFEAIAQLARERGATDATVVELCDRYLPADAPRDGDGLAKWAAANAGRLYFSDVYGYRWFVAPVPAAKPVGSASAPASGGG